MSRDGNASVTTRPLEIIALIAARVDNLTDGAARLRQAERPERGRHRAIEEEDRRDIAERFQGILGQPGLEEVTEEADRPKRPRFDARCPGLALPPTAGLRFGPISIRRRPACP